MTVHRIISRKKTDICVCEREREREGEGERERDLTILQNDTLLELYITADNRTLDGTTISNSDMVHNNRTDNLQMYRAEHFSS